MEVLNELYIGKGPIVPLINQLTLIRNKYKNKTITPSTNLDPEILKFNKIAQNVFGFHNFSLYLQPDNYPNAYTFPVDTYYSEEDKLRIIRSLTASPTGFKYDKAFPGVSMVMAINVGLLNLEEITDDEIMGTILHEIGHGFFLAVTSPDSAFTSSRKLSSIITAVNNFAADKIKKGKKVTSEIIDREVNTFNNIIDGIKKSFNKLHFKRNNTVMESMEDNMRKNRVSYTNEKFADTFAAMYGYGEAVQSMLLKIVPIIHKMYNIKPKKYLGIIEKLKMYNLYFNDLIEYVLNIQDEHPEQLARIKTTAEYLKREIAKEGIDPSLKKELIQELNKINEMIEQYMNFPKDEDTIRIVRLYHNKLYEKFGGDRREKDTDNEALFNFIDSRFDMLNNKK